MSERKLSKEAGTFLERKYWLTIEVYYRQLGDITDKKTGTDLKSIFDNGRMLLYAHLPFFSSS